MLLQAHASLLKRGWLEYDDSSRKIALGSYLQGLYSANSDECLLASQGVVSLVSEMISSRSTVAGLPWEFHYRCRRKLERHGGLIELATSLLSLLFNCGEFE